MYSSVNCNLSQFYILVIVNHVAIDMSCMQVLFGFANFVFFTYIHRNITLVNFCFYDEPQYFLYNAILVDILTSDVEVIFLQVRVSIFIVLIQIR